MRRFGSKAIAQALLTAVLICQVGALPISRERGGAHSPRELTNAPAAAGANWILPTAGTIDLLPPPNRHEARLHGTPRAASQRLHDVHYWRLRTRAPGVFRAHASRRLLHHRARRAAEDDRPA